MESLLRIIPHYILPKQGMSSDSPAPGQPQFTPPGPFEFFRSLSSPALHLKLGHFPGFAPRAASWCKIET
jgi:hypothetical protein